MNTEQTISINIRSCKKKILDSYFIFHINGKIIRKMKSTNYDSFHLTQQKYIFSKVN